MSSTPKISKAEYDSIRRCLFIPKDHPFPRCPAKNQAFVKRCEEKGDYTHSGTMAHHICEECRCKHVAGWGTKGDWYGLGEHTGHYGAGFCSIHESGRRKAKCDELAVHQIRDMQRAGFAYESGNVYLARIQEEAEEAQEHIELGGELALLRSIIQELEAMWYRKPAEDSKIVKHLKQIRDALKGVVFVEEEDAKNMQDIIETAILSESGLTEYASGKLSPMSGDTKIRRTGELLVKAAKIAKDHVALTSLDTVAIDDVKLRAYQTVQLVNRLIDAYGAIQPDVFRKEFLKEYMDVWSSLRTKGQRGGKV